MEPRRKEFFAAKEPLSCTGLSYLSMSLLECSSLSLSKSTSGKSDWKISVLFSYLTMVLMVTASASSTCFLWTCCI